MSVSAHVRSRLVSLTVLATLAALVGSLTGPPPAVANPQPRYQKLKPQQEKSVPAGKAPKSPPRPADPAQAAALWTTLPAPVWPTASSSTVDTSGVADRRAVAGGAVKSGVVVLDRPRTGVAPASVRLDVLDHATATATHQPVLLRVGRADGSPAAGSVRVSVDYSGFRTAYGADWSTRLRLVRLPECALTTPEAAGCQPAELPSVNNTTGMTVSADVSLPAGSAPLPSRAGTAVAAQPTVLLAATAGPSGSAGDYTATKLSPSSSWEAGGSSGDFTWSYPMRVPPSLGGPSASVGLSYSSQSVDGHMAASNNQPSWVGEGFEYQPGAISRAYKGCVDDMGGSANNTVKTGDACWATDNAVMSLSGHSGELIRDDATGAWHPKNDDGSRIEHLTGAVNGDNDGEYWKVTTTDGTQYFFGLNRISGWTSGKPTTNSTFTEPVYGNNPNEPCHQAAFESSWCMQAYEWNLDYVVDTHGNTMSYWYTPETNNYARNLTSSTVSTYTRGGYLSRIDYGTDNRSGTDSDYTAGHAPMQVRFGVADRCIPGSVCDFAHPGSWPDTPVDQNCASTTSCPNLYSPTFWTQKRLDTVTTSVWNTATNGYRDVDRWTMHQSYPDPGDTTRAGLWLTGISHTGLVGGSASVPDVTFTGVQMPNRVDTTTDQSPAMNWWRISYVNTETGGIIGVTYTGPDCVAGSHMPASADTNTMRCYPGYWTRPGNATPTIDWFHKYVVHQVTETDTTGGNPRAITTYDYPNAPAWHYSTDDGLIPPAHKTWSVWRGYDKLVTTVGDPGAQTQTVNRYFRGMNGDHLPSGTRSVSIDGIADEDAFAGMTREDITLNSPGGAEVSESAGQPWQSTATSARTVAGITVTARHTGMAVATTRTDLDGGRAPRTTTTSNTFDNTYGYVTQTADAGDDAVSTDDRCATTTYANNTTAWIIGAVIRDSSYALPCGTAPQVSKDVISDGRTLYDGQAYGAAPTKGDVTEVDTAKSWSSPSNVGWLTIARSSYDAYGRVTDAWDVRNNHAGTAYTPSSGAPLTKVTNTNNFGWTSTTDIEPAWGAALGGSDVNGRRTDASYDPLGRLTDTWLPNRRKANKDQPNTHYTYTVVSNGMTSIATSAVTASGSYVTSYRLLDSLLRARQNQEPSANGTGRVISDTFYDTAGRVVKTNGPYYNTDAAAGTTLFTAQDNQVDSQTVTGYDGAGRTTATVLVSDAVEKWRTTTYYGGDRVDVTPPNGGTATSKVVDARGNTVELRQYHGTTPSGAYDSTGYSYDGKGRMADLRDAAGNHWTRTYDMIGRTIATSDPDAGPSTSVYNDAGDLLTKTDSRGQTLAYTYDSIGRRTGEYIGSTSGTRLAGWAYDTALLPDGTTPARGKLSSSTRYVNGNAYVTTVRGYTDLYGSTGQTVSVPLSEGKLAGNYATTNAYNVDGSLNSIHYPSAGGLNAETVRYTYDATTGEPTAMTTNYDDPTGTPYVTDTLYTPFAEQAVTSFSTGGKLAQQGLYYDPATRRLNEALAVKETAPSTIADAKYYYDPSGNVTKIVDAPADGPTDTQCFTNDYLQRITAAWTPASGDCTAAPTAAGLGGPAPYWQSWTYDVIGNRKTQTDHGTAGNVTTTYTNPAPGTAQPHTATAVLTADTSGNHTATFGYDPAGNTTSRPGPNGQQTLSWDPEGHLGSVTDASGTSSYVYTADGVRLVSHDPTGATLDLGTMTLRYNRSADTVSATRYYTFNGVTIGQRTGGGVTWLVADPHGTQQIAIDANTQSVTQRRTKPYGEPRGSSTTWVNDKGYLGGTADPTGLVHLGAREYDPVSGRFLSVDPIVDTADPQQVNGYSYSDDRPVSTSDPTGTLGSASCQPGEVGGPGACTGNENPPPPPASSAPSDPRGTLVGIGTKKVPHYIRDSNGRKLFVAGYDILYVRYYDRGGVLVSVTDGCADPDAPSPLICHVNGTEERLGPMATCLPGNEGTVCYQKDGWVYDVNNKPACVAPGEVTVTTCGQAPQPVPQYVRDCKPAPPPPPTVRAADPRPLMFSPAPEKWSCSLSCLGSVLDTAATYVGMGTLLGCGAFCAGLSIALTAGSIAAYGANAKLHPSDENNMHARTEVLTGVVGFVGGKALGALGEAALHNARVANSLIPLPQLQPVLETWYGYEANFAVACGYTGKDGCNEMMFQGWPQPSE